MDLMDYIEERSQPVPESGCWIWMQAIGRKGYGYMNGMLVHRQAWIAGHGPIPRGMCVLHRCDVPSCVNPAHLFLGTIADNNADMHTKDRAARGLSLPQSCRFSPEDVAAIQADERSIAAIAREYKGRASYMTILRVKRGDHWSVTMRGSS